MAEYEGMDALLAAITDEPLPEGARDDAEFLAEHRSAVADVALLREQLRIMGDTLAAEAPAGTAPGGTASGATVRKAPGSGRVPPRAAAPLRPPKEARPRRSRRLRHYAGAAVVPLVLAAGTAMLGGLVWLGVQGGARSDAGAKDASAAQSEAGGDLGHTPEMDIACSKVLVEGTVQSITAAGEGNVHVVLKVKRYYRPERSVADHPTIRVTLPASAREDLKVGTYTLVRVPVHPQDRQDWETGWGVGDVRKDLLKALPGARGLECEGPKVGAG
ncbi:hypothetical protein O1Q96_07675 [Streptomyces sp. Qhu-G9]|uniref:hypothetical protein n=1 Tax=Streptomyces sp. Qhu-G9 TaxID=3452799 RepID=UPI0022ABCAAE|nr:hypothetical protein [Streptomyces aurantiacus]WAU79631.1 hypothetical protein O1Q96_07675 [Streptomyces aurantiacus]